MSTIQLNTKDFASQTSSAEVVLASTVTGGAGIDSNKLTHGSLWHMDTGVTPTTGATHIFTTWTKATNQSNASFGSEMTHLSGVFSFPVEGIWQIKFHILCYTGTSQSSRYIEGAIETTTNNATYVETARGITSLSSYNSSTDYGSADVDLLWDVTSTTNNKVRFKTYSYSGETTSFYGATTNNFTYAMFFRLGDT